MRLIISLLLVSLLFSCGQNKVPDVSDINIDIVTHRFEKKLFSLDTNNLAAPLDTLIASYPSFGENFISTILNTDPRWSADSATIYVKGFITAYRNVYDSAEKVFSDFTPYEKEIKRGLQYLKYYYPAYKAPHEIITYIGPMDGYGDILSEEAFIIGLHHHLGKNFSMYSQPFVQEVYASYISNRFEPDHISINCMKNIVMDMYPEKNEDQSLVIQMVEKGKKLFFLSKILPSVPENKLIGYSEEQMKACFKNEARIWELFVKNDLLQTIDNNIIKNYIGESPKTQELGDDSPGNIGSYAGWQIIKKFMAGNPKIKLPELMKIPAETIFEKAKYKP